MITISVHDGHRARIKKQFLETDLSSFEEHQVLEFILFYAVPRGDVNPLAHTLIKKFGSFAAVLEAPISELLKVPGVGENTATLLSMLPQLSRYYLMSKTSREVILNSTHDAGEYLVPRFFGEQEEVVYLLCLDAKGKILSCKCLFRGNVNSTAVSVRKIIETAILCNAVSVIIAHNHTSGIALASKEDKSTTARIFSALETVGIRLLDHIIVADDDYVSLADSGFFNNLIQK